MKKIKFSVIGIGRIGTKHCKHIFNNKRAELYIVCDIIKERADKSAKEYNIKSCYNIKDLLKEDIDVINICTPNNLHVEMSLQALKAGKHVLCEKPMTLNLMDADRIIKAEKESGKKFFLVKQNRYNPPIKLLKDCVYKKKLGKITLINCNVIWNRNKQYYEESDWKGSIEKDCGSLFTQCSHFLDLLLWIGGKVKSVFAKMDNLAHPYIETEDTGFITIKFENGYIGSLQYTTTAYNKNMEGTMTVVGTKGNIKIGGQYLNILEYWDVDGMKKPKIKSTEPLLPNDYGSYKGSASNHDKVIENVISVLLDKKEIAVNSQQGRDSIEVMQAAYLSALSAREVKLPLKGKDYKFKINEVSPFWCKK